MARVLFELEVLRIEDLGNGPFTFTVWVNDVLIEPTADDSVSLPCSGNFAMQVCSNDNKSGEVYFDLSIIKESGCKWLPLGETEPLKAISDNTEGPKVLVAFTKMSLLSPVLEHGSSSERSSHMSDIESPKSFRTNEVSQDYTVLKKVIEDISGAFHAASVAHADSEAKLKKKVADLELKLDAVRRDSELALSDREAMLNRKILDQNLQIEKYRLTLKAQNAALEDVKSQLQHRGKGAEEFLYTKHLETCRANEEGLVKRIQDLENEVIDWQNQLQSSILRESSLRQQVVKLKETVDNYKSGPSEADEILQLQFQLDESEARRLTLQAELGQLCNYWDETSNKAHKTELAQYIKANQSLKNEVDVLSEKLKQSQETVILLQQQETIWKSQIALGESAKVLRLCSNSELMTARESAVETELQNKDLKAQVNYLTQELNEAKDVAAKTDRELKALKTEIENRTERSHEEDLENQLQEFLRSHSMIHLSKNGDGQYFWGNKRLNLQMKRGQLLVRTGGGYMLLEDYFRLNESDPKDSSEGSTTECSDFNDDIENRMLKRPGSDLRERSISPILDYSKPTLSSMGKRVERTPVKENRARTPRKGLHTKRLSAKM
mmetsp:Transcript_1159/g.2797  ORF Transcript_1159/g.2797 Transcript_1159/m.2797 type:complete len:610 (-) Transcript_1159:80-1909(-)